MAAAIVGEALLSAVVEALVGKISTEISEFYQSKKLDESLLEKLKLTLLSLHAFLDDAEEKQIKIASVKAWLDELIQALFDADDLIDDIATEALRRQVEARYHPVSSKVRKVLSSPFKWPYREINSKMQKLFERLEHFAQRAHNLPLEKGVSSNVWRATPTNSAVDDSAICGRDDERKNLREYLLSEDVVTDGGSKIGVLAIVGMGGLGKTTLAKLLYNDAQVNEKFDVKAWASVSKDFDVVKLAKSLLESVTSAATTLDNFDTLRAELQKKLSDKRFLLVLDDIWNARYVDWTNLMHIFNVGQMGSKIIVTTRHQNVVDIVKAMRTCHLEPLANEDCWTLLSKHAFRAPKCTELSSNLEEIGRKIAQKCGGLPLAAVAVGSLLSTKLSTEQWSKVLNSNLWHLTGEEVQPALLLSYHFLPASLKQCFAYCAIFPKNSELHKEKLVQLWMAQGFVYVSQNEKSIEEVGGEYFDELVARSLIRRSADGEHFEMHDLINDLATMVSSPYCKRHDNEMQLRNLNKIRHLSYDKSMFNHFGELDSLHGLKGLRTLTALPFEFNLMLWGHHLANGVLHELLVALKQLRVLSLSDYRNITVLPNSIGDLKHLRYLDLSCTRIERLPSAICKLYNLQTLLLSYCKDLTELPEEMGKLVNLRHLAIDYCWALTKLPEEMGKLVNLRRLDIHGTELQEIPVDIAKLENLQTLSGFIVSKQQHGLKLAEMRKFPHLQGQLCISKLENVNDPSDACQANLKEKKQIKELLLEWSDSTLEDSHQVVLEHLQPSTNLKKLTVKCYGGTSFPSWLGDSSFGNIVSLWIEDCRHCSSLPPVGRLHNLKELFFRDMRSVKSIGSEFYGGNSPSFQPFPSLETLSFGSMEEWEEWNMIDGITTEFPRLSYLYLSSCPKLKGNLPSNLPCLVTLVVDDCCLLESEFSGEVDNRNIMRPLNLFNFNSLQDLSLLRIPSLTSFPSNGLPKALKKLFILGCESLEFPTHEFLQSCKALEDLSIMSSCCSLTSFPLGSLPVLKRLLLRKCKKLKSISILEEEAASQSLMFLEHLEVDKCPELESISLLDSSTPNLSSFWVIRCDKINSLPEPINNLSGLQTLYICDVPNLESIAEEGLPINLRTLAVGNEKGVYCNTDITKWGLDRLTSLSRLWIKGEYLVKKLMEIQVPLLPNSLELLDIEGAREIQHLDGRWLQHLTSLEDIELRECDKLKSLPKEGLPSSIASLEIRGCPMLKASCERKKGKEWPKIAHIPLIQFDYPW
ncbi:putative disease resistance RPP13-like protein 1 isoform X3 [Arachis hypogaea]|uniref:putative disease resistance RPP13-like protein 1 isoform X3 n=1 Tax=Arachis hypogaea TaxID=3818 RepID=UPI000DEC636D|nr:putative disease resistance RPP13-like protein 1 isoform X2 [Arachis hypogaea]